MQDILPQTKSCETHFPAWEMTDCRNQKTQPFPSKSLTSIRLMSLRNNYLIILAMMYAGPGQVSHFLAVHVIHHVSTASQILHFVSSTSLVPLNRDPISCKPLPGQRWKAPNLARVENLEPLKIHNHRKLSGSALKHDTFFRQLDLAFWRIKHPAQLRKTSIHKI